MEAVWRQVGKDFWPATEVSERTARIDVRLAVEFYGGAGERGMRGDALMTCAFAHERVSAGVRAGFLAKEYARCEMMMHAPCNGFSMCCYVFLSIQASRYMFSVMSSTYELKRVM